jgi:uncharacterized protein (DUF433 family)
VDEAQSAQKVYKDLVWQDPGRMAGVPCFFGTRVPVDHLYAFVRQGGNIDGFVESFPTVSKELVERLLAEGEAAILEKLSAA